MRPKTKIILISLSIFLSAGIFFSIQFAKAASCNEEVLKFFPDSQITSVIGLIKSTSGSQSGITSSCSFSLDVSATGIATVKVSKFASAAQAKASFQANHRGSKMGIGDDSSFRSGSDSAALKGQYVFAASWYCFCTDKIYLSEAQARELLSYAVIQIQDNTPPPGTIINKEAIKCTQLTTKYFQPEKVEVILNDKIQRADPTYSATFKDSTTEHCRFQLGRSITTRVWKYASEQLAIDAYRSNLSTSSRKINVGDEADLSSTAGTARKGNFRFQVDKCCGANALNDEEVTELLKLAVSAVGADDDKEEEPKGQKPEITSFSPETISAGIKKSFNENTGVVKYASTGLVITIKGKNLNGAVLSSDNLGPDGKPGIEFKNIESNASGTKVQGYLISHPTAKDGKTIITLTNKDGQSTTFDITVTITGTQYLKRTFSKEKIKLFGDWEEIMPDKYVLELEIETREAIQTINKPTYKKLGIIFHIYELEYWEKIAETKYCGSRDERGFTSGGCARWNDNIIHIAEYPEPKRSIVHEAAHKLHFYYLGFYTLKPPPNNFHAEWKSQLINLPTCTYLPLKGIAWSDGTKAFSHCGFVRSYGAYGVEKGEFYEDVASFVENIVTKTVILGEQNDTRYLNKIKLLNKYGF